MRLALVLLLLGCSTSDPCDPFANQTCITLEVRGPSQIDQLRVLSLELLLPNGLTPPLAGSPFSLPVQTAVLPADPDFAGAFNLDVRGLLSGMVVGQKKLDAQFTRHEHRRLVADLGESQAPADLAGVDLSGVDLAGLDLAAGNAPHWVAESTDQPQQLARVWAAAANDIYLSGYHGGILHSTGDGVWTLQNSGVGTNIRLSGLWGSAANDIYAGGGLSPDQVIIHSTGNGVWTKESIPGVNGVQGIGGIGNTVWASSEGSMLHKVGGTWQKETSGVPATFIGPVFAVAVNAVYACGIQQIVFGTGTLNWSTESTGGVSCNDVWGSGVFDIYCAGGAGTMLHSTGDGMWSTQAIGLSNEPTAVGGSSPSNIYAGGFGGTLFRSTGTGTWVKEKVDMTGLNMITSIFVLPNGDAWATTDASNPGIVLRRVSP